MTRVYTSGWGPFERTFPGTQWTFIRYIRRLTSTRKSCGPERSLSSVVTLLDDVEGTVAGSRMAGTSMLNLVLSERVAKWIMSHVETVEVSVSRSSPKGLQGSCGASAAVVSNPHRSTLSGPEVGVGSTRLRARAARRGEWVHGKSRV